MESCYIAVTRKPEVEIITEASYRVQPAQLTSLVPSFATSVPLSPPSIIPTIPQATPPRPSLTNPSTS